MKSSGSAAYSSSVQNGTRRGELTISCVAVQVDRVTPVPRDSICRWKMT